MRYSRHDAEVAFGRLCDLMGRRTGSWNDVGSWRLDYNTTYGGAVVEEVMNESGGVRHPLGDTRHSAREFCEMVWFAERVLVVYEQSRADAQAPKSTTVRAGGRGRG